MSINTRYFCYYQLEAYICGIRSSLCFYYVYLLLAEQRTNQTQAYVQTSFCAEQALRLFLIDSILYSHPVQFCPENCEFGKKNYFPCTSPSCGHFFSFAIFRFKFCVSSEPPLDNTPRSRIRKKTVFTYFSFQLFAAVLLSTPGQRMHRVAILQALVDTSLSYEVKASGQPKLTRLTARLDVQARRQTLDLG